MIETKYGIAVHELGSNQTYGENNQTLFETMSGIKSVVGTLALEAAARTDRDIDLFSMSITHDHYSNGSGELKHCLDNESEVSPIHLNLRSIVQLSTGASDCVATNALIDYLDGQDTVNALIRNTLGLGDMWLATEKIHFPGVNHQEQPFQVGAATMQEFVNYYKTIWSPDTSWKPLSNEHGWHQDVHLLVRSARLFGVAQAELPPEVKWLHKTGSGTDIGQADFYNTSMDAGMLQVEGRSLVIAAANTTMHTGHQVLSEETIDQDFAIRNQDVLSELGVPTIVCEPVAA